MTEEEARALPIGALLQKGVLTYLIIRKGNDSTHLSLRILGTS